MSRKSKFHIFEVEGLFFGGERIFRVGESVEDKPSKEIEIQTGEIFEATSDNIEEQKSSPFFEKHPEYKEKYERDVRDGKDLKQWKSYFNTKFVSDVFTATGKKGGTIKHNVGGGHKFVDEKGEGEKLKWEVIKIPSYLKSDDSIKQIKSCSTINVNSHVSGGQDSNYISNIEHLLRRLHDGKENIAMCVCDKFDSKDQTAMIARYNNEHGIFDLWTFDKKDLTEEGIIIFNK